ncbi:hypothetical protein C802_02670 [Phocaeicola sartorii]|uniref:Uncharacterized protein n=1 Tax=Phocaeicola sartorii TaxID=671267 RepID=R9I5T8_9BACT|nr:hypothetical protein C802_02670 [Phocaeicola sartorii]
MCRSFDTSPTSDVLTFFQIKLYRFHPLLNKIVRFLSFAIKYEVSETVPLVQWTHSGIKVVLVPWWHNLLRIVTIQ